MPRTSTWITVRRLERMVIVEMKKSGELSLVYVKKGIELDNKHVSWHLSLSRRIMPFKSCLVLGGEPAPYLERLFQLFP